VGHLERFEEAKAKKDWGLARLALDRAGEEIEGELPVQWRCWKVELEIARQRWDSASQLIR